MKAGITGHQDLDKFEFSWIKEQLSLAIEKYAVVSGFSSLAIGADQTFISILLNKEISYTAVIPCRHYEKTFEGKKDEQEYLKLLNQASSIVIMDFEEPSEKAFYEAGKKTVELSEILFAVWDGKKAKGLGGTGDIVTYAKKLSKKILHIDPLLKFVKLM